MKYSKELVTELYQELLSVRMAEEKLVEIYALGKVPGHICGAADDPPRGGLL